MLADKVNIPCRVVKGCKYCKSDDASSCLVRFGLERYPPPSDMKLRPFSVLSRIHFADIYLGPMGHVNHCFTYIENFWQGRLMLICYLLALIDCPNV
jgi:hypothetical protein